MALDFPYLFALLVIPAGLIHVAKKPGNAFVANFIHIAKPGIQDLELPCGASYKLRLGSNWAIRMDQAIRYSRGPAVAIVALEFLILVAFVGDSCWQWSAVGVASHESEAWQGDHCIPVMPQCFFEK